MVENMPILVWDLQSWALLRRTYGGCEMLSILTSSGEKMYFTGLPKPGNLVLLCRFFSAKSLHLSFAEDWSVLEGSSMSHTTASKTLLWWKSAACTVLTLAKEACWIKRWTRTKSSLEMLWVTIACGGFIHPGLVAYVGRECWLTMPQLLSHPTHWSCVGPLQHNKEEGSSISCLSLHWEWLQSIKARMSEKAHQSHC